MTDNELIAEFMGLKLEIVEHEEGTDYDWSNKIKGQYWAFEQAPPFDRSWDWLMPVVDKIEAIRHIGIDAIYFNIKGKQAQIWTYFDVKEFLRLTGDDKNDDNKFKVGVSGKTKIEAVLGACVEFIKWYNSLKK